VVVENRPGGNGFIAVKQVLAAPADGYTVFIGSNSTLAVNVALFRKLPYDPVKDFAPLSMLMHAPALLVVPQDSPHQSVASLVAAARKNAGKLNYAAGSAGYQLMAELFNDAAQVQTTHVPFKSAAEALTGVASGLVDFTFADITAALPMVQGGKLRALAIASNRRSTALPAVPTSAQAGFADVIASVWVGATVHAKTPPAEAAQLAKLFSQIKRMPETQEFYARLGADATEGGAPEMQSFQKEDIERWKRIAAKAKIELQE
jgi:tripartite-type tricarboxylate transporter receptor subunit TctC